MKNSKFNFVLIWITWYEKISKIFYIMCYALISQIENNWVWVHHYHTVLCLNTPMTTYTLTKNILTEEGFWLVPVCLPIISKTILTEGGFWLMFAYLPIISKIILLKGGFPKRWDKRLTQKILHIEGYLHRFTFYSVYISSVSVKAQSQVWELRKRKKKEEWT